MVYLMKRDIYILLCLFRLIDELVVLIVMILDIRIESETDHATISIYIYAVIIINPNCSTKRKFDIR